VRFEGRSESREVSSRRGWELATFRPQTLILNKEFSHVISERRLQVFVLSISGKYFFKKI
jgi:hypothetical protein